VEGRRGGGVVSHIWRRRTRALELYTPLSGPLVRSAAFRRPHYNDGGLASASQCRSPDAKPERGGRKKSSHVQNSDICGQVE